jgi:hypothetical protein
MLSAFISRRSQICEPGPFDFPPENRREMKREVEKEVRLPAFSLQMGELELLYKRMSEVFADTQPTRRSIALSIPNESLQFDSVEEIKGYSELRGRITNFSISMSCGAQSITVKSGGFFSNTPILKVQGESDLWCASAVEAVSMVINRNKTWYWWLVRLPFTLLFFLAAMMPYALNWILSKEVKFSPAVSFAWFSTVMTLGFVTFTREKLLPQAAIVITNDLGFLRRYGAEIGLALGVLSFVSAILMWWFPRAA